MKPPAERNTGGDPQEQTMATSRLGVSQTVSGKGLSFEEFNILRLICLRIFFFHTQNS